MDDDIEVVDSWEIWLKADMASKAEQREKIMKEREANVKYYLEARIKYKPWRRSAKRRNR